MLTRVSEVGNTFVVLHFTCSFPKQHGQEEGLAAVYGMLWRNLPLALVCFEKVQDRLASFTNEGIFLSPQATKPQEKFKRYVHMLQAFLLLSVGASICWECLGQGGEDTLSGGSPGY